MPSVPAVDCWFIDRVPVAGGRVRAFSVEDVRKASNSTLRPGRQSTEMTTSHSAPHEQYMRRCIELARRSLATSDAPVGALVVLNDQIVAEGIEGVRGRRDVTGHAEIEAVRAACERLESLDLSGCTLYTSVEPCVMCAYAIRLARVSRVVAGARSIDAAWALNGWRVLTSGDILPDRPPPSVIRDVLSGECSALSTER